MANSATFNLIFDASVKGAEAGFKALSNSAVKASQRIVASMNNIEKSVGQGLTKAIKMPLNALGSIASGTLKVLKGAVLGAGAAFIASAYKGIDAANELNDAVGLVNSTFGENAEEMHEWAKSSASAYGIARIEAEKYFSSVGAYLKNAGVSSDQSSIIAMNMTGKAGELSRAYGVSSEKAFEALTKGIETGSKKSLMQFGVVLSEDAYNAELLAEGINKTYNELSAEDQLIVRYNTVMSQLGDVTGATANEFATWEGAVAGLVSNTKDALASFGLILQHYLLPVIQLLAKVMQALSASFSNMLANLGIEVGGGASTEIEDYSAAIEGLGDATEEAGKKAKKGTKNLLGIDKLNVLTEDNGSGTGVIKAVTNTVKAVNLLNDAPTGGLKSLKEMLDEFLQRDWKADGIKVGEGINKITNALGGIGTWLKENHLGSKIGDFVNGLTEAKVWENATKNLVTLCSGILTTIGDFFSTANMLEIGKQAIGGLVTGLEENKEDIAEALKNILNGIGDLFIGLFDPKEMGKLGENLADVVNDVADSGAISKVAQALTTIALGIISFLTNFFMNVDWLNLAGEILKGIGNAIKENPEAVLTGLAAWLAWSSVKHLFTGLSGIGKGIGGSIADGINETTVAGGVLAVAVAGVTAIIATGVEGLKGYIASIKELEKSTDSMEYYIEDYKGMNQDLKITAEADLNDANSRIVSLTSQLGTLNKQLNNSEIDATEYAKKYGFLAQSLAEAYNVYGLDTGALLKSAQELQQMDLDELTAYFRDEEEVNQITATEQEIWGMLTKAAKDWDESYKMALSKSDEALVSVNDGAEKAGDAAIKVGEKTTDLAKVAKELADVDLPAFKKNLEELRTPLDDFISRVQTIVDLKWDGQLVDNDALQANLDIAVGKVQQAAKDIDAAIANASNLRNFEAVLDSTQTIKVDTSGKIGVSVDAKAHIDSSELNTWYTELQNNNKYSRG